MSRRILFSGACVFAFATVFVAPSFAKVIVTGEILCDLTGSMTISPKARATLKGTLTNCVGNYTGTNGALIDGGTVVVRGKCESAMRVAIKFTSAGITVATSKEKGTMDLSIGIVADGFVSGGNAFKKQELLVDGIPAGTECIGGATTTINLAASGISIFSPATPGSGAASP
jgi:hypothetical protein